MSTTATDCTRCGMPAEAHPGNDRLALATRTMRARKHSSCPACHLPVRVGQQIARVIRPTGWIHVGCLPSVATVKARHGEL